MDLRSHQRSRSTLSNGGLSIVLLAEGAGEADQIAQSLSELKSGRSSRLVRFSCAGDLLSNIPTVQVDMVVLASDDSPAHVREVLQWTRKQWLRSLPLVVGWRGGGAMERAARENGALFFLRPVSPGSWNAVMVGVLRNRAYKLSSA